MKRKLKAIVCLGLSILVMMSCISGVSAVTSDTIMSSRTITVDPFQASDEFLDILDLKSNKEDFIAAVTKIAQGISEFKESIDISEYNISYYDGHILDWYLEYGYPELFNYRLCGGSNLSDKKITRFYPVYWFSEDEKDKYFTPFNAEIEKIVAEAEKCSNDFLKALFVHDYIVANCKYATEIEGMESGKIPYTFYNAYGCLVEKRCVCMGYSMAYKAVMKKLSIPVGFADSDVMGHIWNTVTIDGKTYHIDLTWDDPVYKNQETNKLIPGKLGHVRHANFLCTDEEIMATGHKSWKTLSTISETSYPNRFWDDIDSKICINGNEVIYAAYDDTKYSSHLERRNLTTNKASVIKSKMSGAKWKYVGNFSRLELIGDVLYYSLPNGVNAIALDGSDDQSVYTIPQTATGRLYGFVQRNGKFFGEISTAPNTDSDVIELTLSEFKRSVIPGDVNGDGVVTMLDAILTQKYALSFFTPDEKVKKAADVNGDGVISVYDALIIQKRVLAM